MSHFRSVYWFFSERSSLAPFNIAVRFACCHTRLCHLLLAPLAVWCYHVSLYGASSLNAESLRAAISSVSLAVWPSAWTGVWHIHILKREFFNESVNVNMYFSLSFIYQLIHIVLNNCLRKAWFVNKLFGTNAY